MIKCSSAPVAKERLSIECRSPALRADGFFIDGYRCDCRSAAVTEQRLVIRNRIPAVRAERSCILLIFFISLASLIAEERFCIGSWIAAPAADNNFRFRLFFYGSTAPVAELGQFILNNIPAARTEQVLYFGFGSRVFCTATVTEEHLRIGGGIAALIADGHIENRLLYDRTPASVAEPGLVIKRRRSTSLTYFCHITG